MSDATGMPPNPPRPPAPPATPGAPVNPYAPPKADIASVSAGAPTDAESIRRELLSHEASIRSVGTLYVIGGVLALIGTLFMLIGIGAVLFGEELDGLGTGTLFGLTIAYGLFAAFSIYLGLLLRKADGRAKTGTTILSVLGLLGFPIGTLINAFILYLLHSEKGKRVLAPEYQEVIAATPHIRYKTPTWLIVLLVLFAALIALLLLVAIFAPA